MLKAGFLSLMSHRVLINTGFNGYSSNNRKDVMSKRGRADNKHSLSNFISYLVIYSITNSLLYVVQQKSKNMKYTQQVFFSKDAFSQKQLYLVGILLQGVNFILTLVLIFPVEFFKVRKWFWCASNSGCMIYYYIGCSSGKHLEIKEIIWLFVSYKLLLWN